MKQSRFSEQQIALILKQTDEGASVEEGCRKAGVSQQTYYRWRKKCAGLMPSEVRRLKELEEENARLKRMVADLSLDKDMLQDQRRRTPDLNPLVHEKRNDLIGEIPGAYEVHVGRKITPEEHTRIEDPDFLGSAKGNAFSGFAAAKPRYDVLKVLRNTSIITGVLRNPKKSFVIGSRPIVAFHDWFTVHQSVASRLESPAGADELLVLDDISEVRRINEGIVRESTIFAGPSRQLVDSLARPR